MRCGKANGKPLRKIVCNWCLEHDDEPLGLEVQWGTLFSEESMVSMGKLTIETMGFQHTKLEFTMLKPLRQHQWIVLRKLCKETRVLVINHLL